MAVKKETTAKKTTAKKTVAKTTAPKKTTTVKKAVVKKETTPRVAKKKVVNKGKKLPGGFLMVLFLIVAAVAAIVTIIGTIVEYRMDTIGTKLSSDLILFIKQCKDASIGIFGIFIVLALFVGFTKRK